VTGSAATVLVATNDPALIQRMDQVWRVGDGRVLETRAPG